MKKDLNKRIFAFLAALTVLTSVGLGGLNIAKRIRRNQMEKGTFSSDDVAIFRIYDPINEKDIYYVSVVDMVWDIDEIFITAPYIETRSQSNVRDTFKEIPYDAVNGDYTRELHYTYMPVIKDDIEIKSTKLTLKDTKYNAESISVTIKDKTNNMVFKSNQKYLNNNEVIYEEFEAQMVINGVDVTSHEDEDLIIETIKLDNGEYTFDDLMEMQENYNSKDINVLNRKNYL